MAETGLPVSLIVKTVESADELPVLQPADLTKLASQGVAPEVLEAVVERKRLGTYEKRLSGRPEAFRKVRVTAQIKKKRLFFGVISSANDALPVYWGVAALDGGGKPLPVDGCVRESACWCLTATGEGTCAKPGGQAWDQRFSCFQAIKMKQDETVEVLDMAPPEAAAEIRVYAFFMARDSSGAVYMEPYGSEIGPAYLSISLHGSRDYTAEAHLSMEVGRGTDTTTSLAVRRFDDRDRGISSAPDYIELSAMPSDFIPKACIAQ